MLTPDLLPVRRKNGELLLTSISGKVRKQHLELAEQVLEVVRGSVGATREQLQAELATIGHTPQESRIVRGLAKLVEDASTYEEDRGRGAAERREILFDLAARAWKVLPDHGRFDRASVLAEAAAAFSVSSERFESELFVDLPAAQRVLEVAPWTPEQLVENYEEARVAAVLLRAVRVTATFRVTSVLDVRRLFRTLKFRQLMFELERLDDGRYRAVLTGPYSLFESVTKYGLQLALCWSELKLLDDLKLEAELRWGKESDKLRFCLEANQTKSRRVGEPELPNATPTQPDEIRELAAALTEIAVDATVADGEVVLELPGIGLCVPDLCYRTKGGQCVHIEVLGYWSRASVWQRVELVERGLIQPILFVVSSRLRVSEEVLDERSTSALYVYRNRINAATVAARVNDLLGRLQRQQRPVRSSK